MIGRYSPGILVVPGIFFVGLQFSRLFAEICRMRILLAGSYRPIKGLVKRALHRFHHEWVEAENGFDAFQFILTQKFDFLILDYDLPRMKAPEILARLLALESYKPIPCIVLTANEEERIEIETKRFVRTEVIARPMVIRRFVSLFQQLAGEDIRLACIGGGTGLFTLLSGLKTLTGVHLSSIVSMSDDGGSTGILRDIFGILPPGDVRRSLIALSSAPDLLNQLMQYRFDRGVGLQGHNLGNLLLTALSEIKGNMTAAVKSLGEILNIQGEVIPVTETNNRLCAKLDNEEIIRGEHRINLFEGYDPRLKIKSLWQEPEALASPDAIEAILKARYILLGPGDLFTSIICNLTVRGIRDALKQTRAKKIFICNVMTKPGETTDFMVSDHVRELVKYLGGDILDYVLCSSTQFSYSALQRYAKKNQVPVIEVTALNLEKLTRAKIVWADLVSETELVRHDSLKLASEIRRVIESDSSGSFV